MPNKFISASSTCYLVPLCVIAMTVAYRGNFRTDHGVHKQMHGQSTTQFATTWPLGYTPTANDKSSHSYSAPALPYASRAMQSPSSSPPRPRISGGTTDHDRNTFFCRVSYIILHRYVYSARPSSTSFSSLYGETRKIQQIAYVGGVVGTSTWSGQGLGASVSIPQPGATGSQGHW